MTEKDTLIRLLCSLPCDSPGETNGTGCPDRRNEECKRISDLDYCIVNRLADHLLANGVIVPPCKVGDTVYMPWEYKGEDGIAILQVAHIIVDGLHSYVRTDLWSDDEEYIAIYDRGRFNFKDFGKTVFLTHEDAQKALEGGEAE